MSTWFPPFHFLSFLFKKQPNNSISFPPKTFRLNLIEIMGSWCQNTLIKSIITEKREPTVIIASSSDGFHYWYFRYLGRNIWLQHLDMRHVLSFVIFTLAANMILIGELYCSCIKTHVCLCVCIIIDFGALACHR